jgi:hypothetical protein
MDIKILRGVADELTILIAVDFLYMILTGSDLILFPVFGEPKHAVEYQ